MANETTITVEVIYALPSEQHRECVKLPRGGTARDVLDRATAMTKLLPGDRSQLKLGIYSRLVTLDTVLEDGDRLEIYRPLRADPKSVRRKLAGEGKSMGKSRHRNPK